MAERRVLEMLKLGGGALAQTWPGWLLRRCRYVALTSVIAWSCATRLTAQAPQSRGVSAADFLGVLVLLAAAVGPLAGMVAYRAGHPERSVVVGALLGAVCGALPLAFHVSSPAAVVTIGVAAGYGVGVGTVVAVIGPVVRDEYKRQRADPMRRVRTLGLGWLAAAGLCAVTYRSHTDIAAAVAIAQVDSLHARVSSLEERRPNGREVLFFQAWGATVDIDRIAEAVRERLPYPFAAVRTDSASLVLVPDTVVSDSGREHASTDAYDQETGEPVLRLVVGPIVRTGLRSARVYTGEIYWPTPHFMSSEWDMVKEDGQWVPAEYRMTGIN